MESKQTAVSPVAHPRARTMVRHFGKVEERRVKLPSMTPVSNLRSFRIADVILVRSFNTIALYELWGKLRMRISCGEIKAEISPKDGTPQTMKLWTLRMERTTSGGYLTKLSAWECTSSIGLGHTATQKPTAAAFPAG